jgi:hypothetical protein
MYSITVRYYKKIFNRLLSLLNVKGAPGWLTFRELIDNSIGCRSIASAIRVRSPFIQAVYEIL